MSRIVFLNGQYVPAAEATVSIMDRGFTFADGIYEVTAVARGKLVDNDAHLARLTRSLSRSASTTRTPMPNGRACARS